MTMSAVLAGAVYGDHVSPISDTTIMASSGAQCNHIDHVKTQFPYATIVAAVSAITYLACGFIATTEVGSQYGASAGITLAIGFVLLAGVLVALYFLDKKGIADKMEEAFAKVLSKFGKNTKLEDTAVGGHEVSDEIAEAQFIDENEPEDKE